MTDAPIEEPADTGQDDPAQNKELPYPCERCGTARGRYMVGDLQEQDTSLYCETCLIITFAEAGNEVFKELA